MPTSRFFVPSFLAALVALNACKSDPEGEDGPLDHTVVWEQLTHDKTHRDTPYAAETVTLFRTEDSLPDLDVRALRSSGDRLYIGTPSGLFVLSDGDDTTELVGTSTDPVQDLALDDQGRLLVARADRVEVVSAAGQVVETRAAGTASVAVAAVAQVAQVFYVGTDAGLRAVGNRASEAVADLAGVGIRGLAATADGRLWIATDAGLRRYDTTRAELLSTLSAPEHLADDDVRAVTLSPDGSHLLVATATGLSKIAVADDASTIQRPGLQGLPYGDLRVVDAAGDWVLTGHGIGATAKSAEHMDYYNSKRWIPDEEVTAVALGADGTRFIGTPRGLSRIHYEETSLAQKAALLETYWHRYWRMDGFISVDVKYEDPWDLSTEPFRDDIDNDGLWTEMQIGTWCYAYAVTGDEDFYAKARRALDVMFLQFDIPAKTFEAAGFERGFITRSLVRDDEGLIFDEKEQQSNWHLQTYEGRDYYWKDDTSSDEYAGHYFGIPIFYDLCAKTEEEREEIRTRIRSSTDYLIDNDYLLIDLDGEPTLHGRWNDLAIAADGMEACLEVGDDPLKRVEPCTFSRYGGGWLNSVEILGHLLAAWHITGDAKYYDEYERLFTEERYGEMIRIIDDTWTVTRPAFANHSDHELAMVGYITLLRYDPNADRRAQYIRSLLDFYEYEREEHNPWQVAVIATAHPGDVDLDGAIQTLEDLPIDWREWFHHNSHRQDAEPDVNDRGGDPQFKSVFPYDELRTMKWNANPYEMDRGGDGREVLAPTPYLIAYWMLRYYGMIE